MELSGCSLYLLLGTLIYLCQPGYPHAHPHANSEHVGPPEGFHDAKVVQDPEHIKEHLEGKAAINESAMTPEELQFHYFKLHDLDNNTKLDGLEILKALMHIMSEDELDVKVDAQGKTKDAIDQEKVQKSLEKYVEIVDTVLKEDDIDNDGYMTWLEFVIAQRRAEQAAKEEDEKEDALKEEKKQET